MPYRYPQAGYFNPGSGYLLHRVNRSAACCGFNDLMVVVFGFGPGSPEDQGEVAPCVCPNRHNQVFLHHVRSISHLHRLARLHDQGVLSDAAYAAAKRRILDRDDPGPTPSPTPPPAS